MFFPLWYFAPRKIWQPWRKHKKYSCKQIHGRSDLQPILYRASCNQDTQFFMESSYRWTMDQQKIVYFSRIPNLHKHVNKA
jgi:hypothetical protein